MSVTFNGSKGGKIVRTPDEMSEDSVGFNLANGNASAFLRFLKLPNEPCGSIAMPELVRAVQRARASFDYRVDAVTRKPYTGTGALGCRVFGGGIDDEYFERRLTQFENLLADWMELGADEVTWG